VLDKVYNLPVGKE